MNYDEVTVQISPAEQNPDFDRGFSFLVTVLINGKPLPDVLDVDEFFMLLGVKRGETQRLPLFNCTYGCFGCGGFYVNVTNAAEAVRWEAVPPIPSKKQRPELPSWSYVFSWNAMKTIAEEIFAAFYTAQAQSVQDNNGEVRYGATGVEISEQMPFYLECYNALSFIK